MSDKTCRNFFIVGKSRTLYFLENSRVAENASAVLRTELYKNFRLETAAAKDSASKNLTARAILQEDDVR